MLFSSASTAWSGFLLERHQVSSGYQSSMLWLSRKDEAPPDVPTDNAQIAAITAPQLVPAAEFEKLSRMPIQLVYGDNMTREPSPILPVLGPEPT